MKPTHKAAEERYQNTRELAYDITQSELPYQDKSAIKLTEITSDALRMICSSDMEVKRKVDWSWEFGVRVYRKRYPNRFELALWYNSTLCGLSLGRPSFNGTRVRLDFIERIPINHNPLIGRVTPITVTAYEVYARLIDATEVRIIEPAQELITYYSSFNYLFVKGTGTDMNPSYLFKKLEC
jgi:hypothetical protein